MSFIVDNDGASVNDYDHWVYHHGTQDGSGALVTTGTVQVTPPTSGSFYIAMLANNGYTEMAARININVEAAGGSTVTIASRVFNGKKSHNLS